MAKKNNMAKSLQEIIESLQPLNKKEKVDALILQMKESGLKLSPENDLMIRTAMRKVSVQLYFVKKYVTLARQGQARLEKIEQKRKQEQQQKQESEQKKRVRKAARIKSVSTEARMMRAFGSHQDDAEKSKRDRMRRDQSHRASQYSPIYSEKSIQPIYIASGGMNKRY